MNRFVEKLQQSVQRNCDISDAQWGAEYGLCTYLMKMREYYRWEHGMAYGERLPKDEVGDWLMAREQLWEGLQGVAFERLEVDGELYDPFDTEAINRKLTPLGLVYSGGVGRSGRSHFFLAWLERHEAPEEFSLYVAGSELARDLSSPPAMNCGQAIFVRRESLRRMLWEKLENWRWSRPENALGRAFSCYDFEGDLDVALDAMTDAEMETLLLHERGEYEAGRLLGQRWNDMVLSLSHTPAELMARAVRDHLADCTMTLPHLLDEGRDASIHFVLGNFSAMRKSLFPSLQEAYDTWVTTSDRRRLRVVSAEGRAHWQAIAERMLDLYHRFGEDAAEPIHHMVEENHL